MHQYIVSDLYAGREDRPPRTFLQNLDPGEGRAGALARQSCHLRPAGTYR